jgi:hypothetical protein
VNEHISILGVILAAASAFIVGSIWYSPKTFLPRWQKITGATDAHMKKSFGMAMAWNGIAALVTSYALAHLISYCDYATGASGISGGVETAFFAWVGLSLTTLIATSSLDPRDKFITVIQGGERLVTLLVMGIILGAFM